MNHDPQTVLVELQAQHEKLCEMKDRASDVPTLMRRARQRNRACRAKAAPLRARRAVLAEHPPACALNARRLPRAGGASSACARGETAQV